MAKHVAEASYTDAELLELYRAAYASIAAGAQRYRIGTREFQAADLNHIREQIEWLESRIARSGSGGLGHRNVRFKRPGSRSTNC